jgi:gluconate 2-dehydrogenase gamma chain
MKKYPSLTVRKLLQTDFISPQTKMVLNARLAELDEKYEPVFFHEAVFKTLSAVADRLIPQVDTERYIDLAAAVDRRLAEGKTDGWRYASMPPDSMCYRLGLTAIDELSTKNFSRQFNELEPSQQDEILLAVQQGNVAGDEWKVLPHLFFEELLAELVEAYYSHPLAQEEIGYVGMADVHGWKHIGLNNLEPHEPQQKE